MGTVVQCSNHARLRQAQRNLSDEDVSFVLQYGRRSYHAGVLCVFLGWRDIPNEKPTYQRFSHLEGTMLKLAAALCGEMILVTAYRNRRAGSRMRKRAKYDCRSHRAARQKPSLRK